MTAEEWKALWQKEEARAHIHGWDFSPIQGRFAEEHDLPWSYRSLVQEYLRDDLALLDCDTGGGEFLLSLGHPPERTAATEGYPPNVRLCRETLAPLGVDFQECAAPSAIPFPDESFDLILSRHGAFVWFARVIEWEFPGFSVDRCFDRLLAMQEELEKTGEVRGTIHRYLILAQT